MHPAQFHIIGHSLGAHTAGFAGARVPGLGRITGLDPADPCFDKSSPSGRLDSSDADFVDVIHTNGKYTDGMSFLVITGSGMSAACGDVDFYPNGGLFQPGCTELLGCSHNRAVQVGVMIRQTLNG
jgi:hypothetical protein